MRTIGQHAFELCLSQLAAMLFVLADQTGAFQLVNCMFENHILKLECLGLIMP